MFYYQIFLVRLGYVGSFGQDGKVECWYIVQWCVWRLVEERCYVVQCVVMIDDVVFECSQNVQYDDGCYVLVQLFVCYVEDVFQCIVFVEWYWQFLQVEIDDFDVGCDVQQIIG